MLYEVITSGSLAAITMSELNSGAAGQLRFGKADGGSQCQLFSFLVGDKDGCIWAQLELFAADEVGKNALE